MCDAIRLIVASTPDGGIGARGAVPWDLPGERRWFREWTRGDTVIMGRRTWESLGGTPLADRKTIVVSSTLAEAPKGVCVVSTLAEAIAKAATETVWIVGGARMYDSALVHARMVVMTTVYGTYECDARVPAFAGKASLARHGFACTWTSRLFRDRGSRYRHTVFTRAL